MKRLLAALVALFVFAAPVSAAGSISVNEPGPYHHFDTVTLTVVVPKLKGYQYPVVLIRCSNDSEVLWTYFRRWDDKGYPPEESGPEPVVLGGDPGNASIRWNAVGGAADCTIELYAYGGLNHPNPRLLTSAPDIHVEP